ncbi:hypothetical protein LZ32DRAFT_81229 [Colletotrichum eremochloae]|nr:hypothetical protein LZ32DRAFT_81229 [Colletotrichum eremochloae]
MNPPSPFMRFHLLLYADLLRVSLTVWGRTPFEHTYTCAFAHMDGMLVFRGAGAQFLVVWWHDTLTQSFLDIRRERVRER